MPEGYIRVATLSDVDVGGVVGVVVDGKARVLVRPEERVVLALDGVCTHQFIELTDGELEDGVLWCPMHGGGFDVQTGKAVCPPAVDALRRYDARLEGDEIFVAIAPDP